MSIIRPNISGLMELMESSICRADALAGAVRLNLESASASLYSHETKLNLDTLRDLLADAKRYQGELSQQLRDKEAK